MSLILRKSPTSAQGYKWTSDWDPIYTNQLKKRAEARYEYDVLQGHGIGAYDELQEQKLNKLHQFFIDFEKTYTIVGSEGNNITDCDYCGKKISHPTAITAVGPWYIALHFCSRDCLENWNKENSI